MKLCMKLILITLLSLIYLPYFNYAWHSSAAWILAHCSFGLLLFLVLFWNFFRLSRVFDCRVEDSYRAWVVNGEVERVLWNHFSPFNFLVSIPLIYHFLIYTVISVKKCLESIKLNISKRIDEWYYRNTCREPVDTEQSRRLQNNKASGDSIGSGVYNY